MTEEVNAPGIIARWQRIPVLRRWIILLGVIGALAVVMFVAKRKGAAPDKETAAREKTAGLDSVVVLDTAAQRLVGIELLTVSVNTRNELSVNGVITFDADRVSIVAPRAEGRLLRMRADLGDHVAAGQVVAEVESSEIGQIRGDLERAQAAVDVTKRNYEREKRLFEQSISAQREVLDAEIQYRTASADVRSALAKLRTFGATTGQGGSYGLTSAVTGTVVERNGSPGQLIGPATNLMTVADLRHVWITVDVYEADFTRIHPGAMATIFPVALAGEAFRGRVRSMGGVVDTASRTFKVRVLVENSAQRLRPGMFAQVQLQTPPVSAAVSDVAIPEIAVQDLSGKAVVFVATATAGRFVARPVDVGPRTGNGSVIITHGLHAGERVVVKGAFQLKSEITKASFGEEG